MYASFIKLLLKICISIPDFCALINTHLRQAHKDKHHKVTSNILTEKACPYWNHSSLLPLLFMVFCIFVCV